MNTTEISRRALIRTGLGGGLAMAVTPGLVAAEAQVASVEKTVTRKGRIRQSVCRWCYQAIALDELCAFSAKIGLKGIDLLQPEEWSIPQRYGLVCTMGYAGGGEIGNAMNRIENHSVIEEAFRKNIPIAAKMNVPNVITFSGNRRGMADSEGVRNTVTGLNRVKKIAEDNGVTINLELLNSRKNHPDYMADHTAWGVEVMEQVNSPNVKLLYDIYHMQIMEGDLIQTIRDNIRWIGHFHTGGVPGRNELNDQQEVQWDGVMRAIAELDFKDYVAHEFEPKGDPFAGLRQAADLCDV
ncbi:MAG: TIM barrel protein [Terracidiphilus sp.]|jgi:hydroxypyruvate isomerase